MSSVDLYRQVLRLLLLQWCHWGFCSEVWYFVTGDNWIFSECMEYLDILWSKACFNENAHKSYICSNTVLYLLEYGRDLTLTTNSGAAFPILFLRLWHQTISAYQNLFMLSIVLIIFRHHLSLRYLVILRPHLNWHSQRNGRQIKFWECLVPFGSLYFVFAPANNNTRKIKTYKTQFWMLFCIDMKLGLFHKGKNVQLGMYKDRILKRNCEPERK